MKRTILLPTDFRVESLRMIHHAIENTDREKLDIILFYSVSLSDFIIDLLFFSKKKYLSNVSNKPFEDACDILFNKYESKLDVIRVELFYGYTQSAFNNFIEGNKVDEIYLPIGYELQLDKSKSIDPVPFILMSNVAITEVKWNGYHSVNEKNTLAEIFQ